MDNNTNFIDSIAINYTTIAITLKRFLKVNHLRKTVIRNNVTTGKIQLKNKYEYV